MVIALPLTLTGYHYLDNPLKRHTPHTLLKEAREFWEYFVTDKLVYTNDVSMEGNKRKFTNAFDCDGFSFKNATKHHSEQYLTMTFGDRRAIDNFRNVYACAIVENVTVLEANRLTCYLMDTRNDSRMNKGLMLIDPVEFMEEHQLVSRRVPVRAIVRLKVFYDVNDVARRAFNAFFDKVH